MFKSSRSGHVPIIFKSESFPIENATDEMRALITEERRVTASDLWQTHNTMTILYNTPETLPEGSDLLAARISVRRDQSRIFMDVLGDFILPDRTETENVLISSEKLRLDPLMRLMKDYVEYNSEQSEVIKAFTDVGSYARAEGVDTKRNLLHLEMGNALREQLKDRSIMLPRPETDEGSVSMRYLSTALMVHIMPPRVFADTEFMFSNVKPKWDFRATKVPSAGLHGVNPFEPK